MRAMLMEEFGAIGDMVLREVRVPEPRAGEVRISVHAVGVNFADRLIIAGKYQSKPPLPFSAGMEVSGSISAVGPKTSDWHVGDRVMAMCLYGGFAEEVCVAESRVFAVPEAVDLDMAAVFPIAYSTAFHALVDRARLALDEWLVVYGAGSGVGLTAVELGALMGAQVIAVAGSEAKLDAARRCGAQFTINHRRVASLRGQVRELTGGRGADIFFDPVGGDLFDESLHCIAPAGRILTVGFASDRVPMAPANIVLVKGCDILGVHTSAAMDLTPEPYRRRFAAMMRWAEAGQIRPLIAQTFPLEQVPLAMHAAAQRDLVGRVLVRVKLGDDKRNAVLL